MTRHLPTATPLLLILAVALAGCGNVTGSQVKQRAKTPVRGMTSQVSTPAGQPGQPVGGADAAAQVKRILEAVAAGRDQMKTATCEIKGMMVRPEGSTALMKMAFTFKAPSTTLLHVKESNTANMEGTKVSWNGAADVQVKTKFIGFWIKTKLDVGDERLKDAVGYTLKETSMPRMFATLLHPQAQVRFLGEQAGPEGVPTAMLEVISPLRLKPASKEIYGIRQDIHAVVLREMYKGEKVYYRMNMDNMHINPPLGATAFSVD